MNLLSKYWNFTLETSISPTFLSQVRWINSSCPRIGPTPISPSPRRHHVLHVHVWGEEAYDPVRDNGDRLWEEGAVVADDGGVVAGLELGREGNLERERGGGQFCAWNYLNEAVRCWHRPCNLATKTQRYKNWDGKKIFEVANEEFLSVLLFPQTISIKIYTNYTNSQLFNFSISNCCLCCYLPPPKKNPCKYDKKTDEKSPPIFCNRNPHKNDVVKMRMFLPGRCPLPRSLAECTAWRGSWWTMLQSPAGSPGSSGTCPEGRGCQRWWPRTGSARTRGGWRWRSQGTWGKKDEKASYLFSTVPQHRSKLRKCFSL